jgi:S-adenosylmethionine:tRNA ribosyltransferase-isomerase
MKTSDFNYTLPPELIAQTPVEPRDTSRLLVVDRATGELAYRHFRNLPEYLRAGDLLVGNDSRVIPARLRGVKPTRGAVELFLLRPVLTPPGSPSPEPKQPVQERGGSGPARALQQGQVGPGPKQPVQERGESRGVRWECLVGGKGLRPGVQVKIAGGPSSPEITATILAETEAGSRLVAFDPPVEEWLWDTGQVPLPPYIQQPINDPERYQTVYSRIEGSVASPTAGLHFTPELLLELWGRGVNLAFVTLHIGLDTFRPVQTEEIEEHHIHREWAHLGAETARTINETRLAGGRIIAIGTTVVRVLESAARIAPGFRPADDIAAGAVHGWQTVVAFTGETDLFIRPGHRFRAVDGLITNFHLPRSTLLMLVSAFAGKELMDRAYSEAIRERYRFYSFGDAMLIL